MEGLAQAAGRQHGRRQHRHQQLRGGGVILGEGVTRPACHLELRWQAPGGVQLHVVLQGVTAVEPLGAKVARKGHFTTVNEGVLKNKGYRVLKKWYKPL